MSVNNELLIDELQYKQFKVNIVFKINNLPVVLNCFAEIWRSNGSAIYYGFEFDLGWT